MTLLYPPLDDPTMPYHANAYLLGSLRRNGFADASMRDINVEFVNFCLEERTIDAFHERRTCRLGELSALPELSFAEQSEFLGLWQYKPYSPHELSLAVTELRAKDSFLNYATYTANVARISRYFTLLGALCFPGDFINFQQSPRGRYSIYTLQDLFSLKLSDQLCYCFARFFEARLTDDPELEGTDVFGISVTYDYQLVHAMWLARALKRRWPEKRVILGGTALSQVYKYMKIKREMTRFFDMCDAIVVGEGETAICKLAALAQPWNRAAAIPNTITYDKATGDLHFPEEVYYEQLPALGAPVYEYRWDLYLSPARGVNYAPTRGCYWNRCTFCDYGLNTDRPTSPWRERRIDQVIDDLRQAIADHGVEYVYFAVDVMAPGYLERLSDAIVDAGLKFRWSAELRMEKIFSPERCAKMAQAGCVCASFGMESGNQRVLDLIDKGTKVTYMEATLRNFAHAGIAVQLMTFSGFPTETQEEKNATIEFIKTNKEYWSGGGLGNFMLTGTAIVAKKPELFGITLIKSDKVDIERMVDYFVDNGDEKEAMYTEDYDASFGESAGIFPVVRGRPWAGGIDSLHSMIYYNTHGRFFFKENDFLLRPNPSTKSEESAGPDALLRIEGRFAHCSFNISQMLANQKEAKEQLKRQIKGKSTINTYADFTESERIGGSAIKAQGTYWIFDEEKCMRLDKSIYEALIKAGNTATSIRTLMASFQGDSRLRLEVYLAKLYAARLIRLEHENSTQEVLV